MTKLVYTIFIISIAFSFSCKNENTNNKTNNQKDNVKKTETLINIKDNNKKQLIIEGKNIWARSKPIDGKVLMKLNTGDICKVLDETKEMQVRNMLDKWYKIKFNDTIAWVFGSQTNLKTNKIIKIYDFNILLKEFAKQIPKQNFSNFRHKDIRIKIMHNPGAFCIIDTIKSFQFLDIDKKNILENIFNKKPKGNFCDGYPNIKDGIYYWEIKYTNLPKSADISNPNKPIAKEISIPEKYKNNKIYQVQLIKDEYHIAYFYFINISTKWYLLLENYCDCSA